DLRPDHHLRRPDPLPGSRNAPFPRSRVCAPAHSPRRLDSTARRARRATGAVAATHCGRTASREKAGTGYGETSVAKGSEKNCGEATRAEDNGAEACREDRKGNLSGNDRDQSDSVTETETRSAATGEGR